MRRSSRSRPWIVPFSVALSLLAIAPSIPGFTHVAPLDLALTVKTPAGTASAALPVARLLQLPLASVVDPTRLSDVTGAIPLEPDLSSSSITIVVTLRVSNPDELQAFLRSTEDPTSENFHHYLTAAEFDQNFSPPVMVTQELVAYLQSFGARQITVSTDRLTVTFEAPARVVGGIFHAPIEYLRQGDDVYFSPLTSPELPSVLALAVLEVDGLSSSPRTQLHSDLASVVASTRSNIADPVGTGLSSPLRLSPSGYPAPPTVSGTQLEYGSDFQLAYDEPSLFALDGYPSNAVIATILWSGEYTGPNTTTPYGSLSHDQPVGSFVPGDVTAFFNETIPAGEPQARAFGVPILSAPAPGPFASWDSTGAWVENTLDLEMVGSTAPGASIYNVYGPDATIADVDAAFSFILNPNASAADLRNVSVISNSWGAADGVNSTWSQDLSEAQLRGITVLASTGDSGDTSSSSKYVGGPDFVEFPSSVATDTYGVVAVGGTTVTLGTTLHLASDVVWMDHRTTNGGPYGSTGGVSSEYAEPSWQLDSEANPVIQAQGGGRGVPDLAALANNTLITISEEGVRYDATNASSGGSFLFVAGTSVAAPLTAGIVAEIDHVLAADRNGWLGFLDPTLYSLATREFSPLVNMTDAGYQVTGPYGSALPTLPLLDVTSGANALYAARPGYDLATGWGSLDAYNFTMYVLAVPSLGVAGHLSGVQDTLNLSALAVTSRSSGGTVNPLVNASVQQNFFLANSLGAPIFWIQNELELSRNSSMDWTSNLTDWASFPFPGLYPALTVREYNRSAPSTEITLPTELNVTATLSVPSGPLSAELELSVGGANETVAVPGAAWIFGNETTQYSWQGTNYSNGPWHNRSALGILAPQFGLFGAPTGEIADFTGDSQGNVSAFVQPYGQAFLPAATLEFGLNVSQSDEVAANLSWTLEPSHRWQFSNRTGSSDQGILSLEPGSALVPYLVNFTETGLPSGNSWQVAFTGGGTYVSTTRSLQLTLVNGTYAYAVSCSGHGYAPSAPSGTIRVQGGDVNASVTFVPVAATVTFLASGLPNGTRWSVTLGTQTNASSGPEVGFVDDPGTYPYAIGSIPGYSTAPTSGNVTMSGEPVAVLVPFVPVRYSVTFSVTGLPAGAQWTVTLGGASVSSSSSEITFQESNGTYAYAVLAPAGYLAHAPSSSLTVAGSNVAVGVSLSAAASSAGPGLFGLTWLELALGVLGALAVAAVVAVALARRRRRAPPPEGQKPTGPN